MKKKVLFWIIPIAIIALIVTISISNKKKVKFAEIKMAKVTKGELKSYLSTNGKIKSKNSKDYFGTQGRVKKVNVKVGQNVKKGDILVVYDTPDLNAAVRQAELQYSNALLQKQEVVSQRDSINKKKIDIEDEIKKLENSNNPQDVVKIQSLKQQKETLPDISEEKVKQAENAVELAQIAVSTAKNNLNNSKTQIVCENDGVVTGLNVKEGAVDNGMQPSVTVEDIYNLQAIISLNKYDASKIKLGQQVLIRSGNYEYKGTVSFIDPVAKEEMSATGKEVSLEARIDIIGKAENLKIGFDADVDILISQVNNALKVPSEAIKMDKKGNSFVYVVKDDRAEEKKVKGGIQSDMETEILQGLNSGENVILNPNESIKNGTLVKEHLEGSKK